MAKLNLVLLYARVSKTPVIAKNKETGAYSYGMVYVDAVRGLRQVEDGVNYIRHDHPLIMSMESEILDEISKWKENDIVLIKGVVTTKTIMKTSFCPECTDEKGNASKNQTRGSLVYVTPIKVNRIASYGDDKKAAIEDIVNNREISNQIFVYGTLIREPKIFTTKKKLQITQYPIAINRKFTIRADDPNFRTDWPFVKSYGEHAREDKIFLQQGAEIIVDGFMQARTVHRKCKCAKCGKIYEWADHLMELVPYDTEYVKGHKSEEQVKAEYQKNIEDIKQQIFNAGVTEDLEEEFKSEDTMAESN